MVIQETFLRLRQRMKAAAPVSQTSPGCLNGASARRIDFISMKVSFIDTKLCR
jgi:hypothetical protein